MKKNMGKADRLVRILAAALIVLLYFGNIIDGTIAVLLIILASVFSITSFVGFCPLYTLIGINTCSTKNNK